MCFSAGCPALGQEQPLSVIDWLARNPDKPAMTSATIPRRFEPPVSPNALPPEVSVLPLAESAPKLVGLVPAAVTGLPNTLWANSTPDDLLREFDDLRPLKLPAAQALLNTVLLTEATGPSGFPSQGHEAMMRARAQTLMRLGMPDAALALLAQSDYTRNADQFALYMDAALLTGQEDTACAILTSSPHLAPSLAHRVFCAARQGDWPTAALLFDTGSMLDEMDQAEARVLERFLHPDSYDDLPPLRRPETVTPLVFRLHEAIGEPLPTRSLPRAFAVADLRDINGWKAQLEAAERLAAAGALPANRLLGLYSSREPAASGGVWDRVDAVQQFEAALRSRSADAISKTLPKAWAAMQDAQLDIVFAELFADGLRRYDLQGSAADIALSMALLSPDYRQIVREPAITALHAAIASGDITAVTPQDARTGAIVSGFDRENARPDLIEMARNRRMGEAILRTLSLLDAGAAGDPVALTQALATLRAFGLEDSVIRAALQILLLERYS